MRLVVDEVKSTARVALVSMPWSPVTEPPLGLSILRACLTKAQIQSRIFHFNMSMLRYLWYTTYVEIADIYAINDFIFSGAFDTAPMTNDRLKDLQQEIAAVGHKNAERLSKKVMQIRESVVSNYLDDCMRELVSESPSLIGFTCSFDQTMASIALAKQIRKNMPDVLIAFGGYAVNGDCGEMLLHSFPYIDCIAQGDSELAIIDLAEASVGYRSLSEVRGIQYRGEDNGAIHSTPNLPINLNDCPFPIFDDFYRDKSMFEESDKIRIRTGFLPVETSRGCWWGQKHHCVFCGIDEFTMQYRSRTVDNTICMLDSLHDRYGVKFFRINDYILPYTYHKTLIPTLISQPRPYRIACEAKANITREQVRNLSLAGITEIQPGIESFSSHVLSLMKKGVTASQNVLLLVWGKRYGITIHFNILYGIPGESVGDYKDMTKLIPALYHLSPPVSVTIAIFTKYSPLQEGRVEGTNGTTIPARRYGIVLSREFVTSTGFDMSKYCYNFESPYDPPEEIKSWHHLLSIQCRHWRELHRARQVDLWFKEKIQGIVFYDSRWHSDGEYIYGNRDVLQLYRLLTNRVILRRLWSTETERMGISSEASTVGLEFLLEKRLVVQVDNKLIALARDLDNRSEIL